MALNVTTATALTRHCLLGRVSWVVGGNKIRIYCTLEQKEGGAVVDAASVDAAVAGVALRWNI